MASTGGDNGWPSNRKLWTDDAMMVPLGINSRAHRATSGYNIHNAICAISTKSTAVSASTLNCSLSSAHIPPNPLTFASSMCWWDSTAIAESESQDGVYEQCYKAGFIFEMLSNLRNKDLVGIKYGLGRAYDAQANFYEGKWCRRCLWSHRHFPVQIHLALGTSYIHILNI
uniref:Uncharacterized protein n=1 Tax=Romanomermis culicivorax TaxID=13658 RepID=A0A915JRZ3_ROMCU